ncbi:multidrug effflux MFS transporter [Segnochrobactraceae bacterium EtOH-i3]
MTACTTGAAARPGVSPSFVEFVLLVSLMMGLVSLSIDNLLPAFGPMQAEFGVADPNHLQLVITVYMIGFALMQVVYGPLADVFGRKPVLLSGFGLFAVGTVLAMMAPDFSTLLAARFVQGLGASAPRVLSIAIVRDRFAGSDMARVMSLTMMVFLIVPVVAPATGTLTLMVGNWHLIFISMLVMVAALSLWVVMRLPETLPDQYRVSFSFKTIARGVVLTVTNRHAFGYSTVAAFTSGAIMAYVGSSQQIFETTVYGLGDLFPLAFGAIAGVMSVGAFSNSRLVRRFGPRRLSHGGQALLVLLSAVLVVEGILYDGVPPLLLFTATLAASQFCFALTLPNFNAMAMEPLGSVAGTASSFIGFYNTLAGAVIGLIIGQLFDGSVMPLAWGYLVLALAGFAVVVITERGRVFRTVP